MAKETTKVYGTNTYKVNSAGIPYGAPTPITQSPSQGAQIGTNLYNTKTGAKLTSGESYVNAMGETVKQGTPVYQPTTSITPKDVMGVTPTIPTTPTIPILPNLNLAPTTLEGQKQEIIKKQDDTTSQMLQDLLGNKPESQAQLYQQAQNEAGILAKQQAVSDLSSKLNQIQAQGQAAQLQTVGQGRGIPEAILGGQQAQIARETAIQALPVSAQLSAAQGNLEMANQNLNTLYQIKSADAKSRFEYKNKILETVYSFADKQSQRRLDDINKQLEYQHQDLQNQLKDQDTYAKMAFDNGQSKLGSQITTLDYKSPTFKQDLAALQSKLYNPNIALDRELKQAQINKYYADASEVKANETAAQFKERMAKETELKQKQAQIPILKDKIDLIGQILNNPAITTTIGPTVAARQGTFIGIPFVAGVGPSMETISNRVTGKEQALIGAVNQLVNKEFLSSVMALKAQGGTLGQLTEREGEKLQTAATKIGTWEIRNKQGQVTGYNISEKEFLNEVNRMLDATRKIYREVGGVIPGTPQEKVQTDNFLNIVDGALQTSGAVYSDSGYTL